MNLFDWLADCFSGIDPKIEDKTDAEKMAKCDDPSEQEGKEEKANMTMERAKREKTVRKTLGTKKHVTKGRTGHDKGKEHEHL